MKFSMVLLLLDEEEIPAAVKRALKQWRLQDAAGLLMRKFGLSCAEAGHLLSVSACHESDG